MCDHTWWKQWTTLLVFAAYLQTQANLGAGYIHLKGGPNSTKEGLADKIIINDINKLKKWLLQYELTYDSDWELLEAADNEKLTQMRDDVKWLWEKARAAIFDSKELLSWKEINWSMNLQILIQILVIGQTLYWG